MIYMSIKVRKAVIPAAGLGTRVLPASKAMPKEMLPIVDKPAIQYIVEEAVNSGITDILIITNRGKGDIENHFDRAPELEARLLEAGRRDAYEQIIRVVKECGGVLKTPASSDKITLSTINGLCCMPSTLLPTSIWRIFSILIRRL